MPPPDDAPPLWNKVGATPYPAPAMRWLRVYAFDPQASANLDTATVNNSLVALPWETPWEQPLSPGPCGEYIEVIDHDPASGLFYEPADLNDPALLAQNGLPPSEGRPQFHQQMVYAVAMKTILAFERALGRKIFFAREIPPLNADGRPNVRTYEMVQRLRIYPHALREQNAYYSPGKTAILFGYFQPDTRSQDGDRWVFTCLSQDIIAHETTHAILHGVHRRSIQPSNLDTRAFHEGFADIIALLQHFTMRDVLKQQIAHTRGDMRRKSLLNSLAGQFGQALGRKGGALRVALKLVELDAEIEAAQTDAERQALIRRAWPHKDVEPPAATDILDPEEWRKLVARIRLSDEVREPHERGAYLVAAVFDAFATVYERRTADLMHLGGATAGSASELPPKLVERLASEASKAADHVMRMCVRALDYVPPIDMTFGEYLRAIVTADYDLVPDDPLCYRIAIAQAFRRRGIVPDSSLSMAPDSLVWEPPDPSELPCESADDTMWRHNELFTDLLARLKFSLDYKALAKQADVNLRELNARIVEQNQKEVHRWFESPSPDDDLWARLLGIEMLPPDDPRRRGEPPLRSVNWKKHGDSELPYLQVYSARVAMRAGPDGQELNQLVIQLVQRRRGYFSAERQKEVDANGPGANDEPDFWFRGGATLLIDLRDGRLRYAIRKKINNEQRLERQRAFEKRRRFGAALKMDDEPVIYGAPDESAEFEPFAMAHRNLS